MRFVVPYITEPFERKRRRALLADLKILDAAMESLVTDVRDAHSKAGFVSQDFLVPATSARIAALELGRSDLIQQRNAVLAELASL